MVNTPNLNFQNKSNNENQNNASNSTTESLWKVADVAKYLRLTPETVRMMARQSKIPSIKVGRVWRFKRQDLENWVMTTKKDSEIEGVESH